ncbi:EamA/RhaT family transporter, partial [Streptomyces chryseus]
MIPIRTHRGVPGVTRGTGPWAASVQRPALDWRIRFGVLALIWGFSFLFIKVGTQAY